MARRVVATPGCVETVLSAYRPAVVATSAAAAQLRRRRGFIRPISDRATIPLPLPTSA
jgi:hypothetical protein